MTRKARTLSILGSLPALLCAGLAGFAAVIDASAIKAQKTPDATEANAAADDTSRTPGAPSPSATPQSELPEATVAEAAAVEKHAGLDSFKANCAGCHTIGGGKTVGPDLAGLSERIPSAEWFHAFVRNPAPMIEKDAYAKEMAAPYLPTMMTPFPALTDTVLDDLLAFIKAGGPGLAVKKLDIPMTAEVIDKGRKLFSGELRFASGAPSCLSCHTIAGLGGFGGGNLAGATTATKADLSAVHVRLGGDAGLSNALLSPQFPVMQRIYADKPMAEDEVVALTAYLSSISASAARTGSGDYFALYGVFGAVALLVLFDIAWIGRFRDVRRTLVSKRS